MFRRKPVDVEAVQFDPALPRSEWPPGVTEHGGHWANREKNEPVYGFVDPVNGYSARVRPGDWVVTNQTGERYVVHQEVFFDVYERVS